MGHRFDVTLLLNNAGISTGTNLVTDGLDTLCLEIKTHYFGTSQWCGRSLRYWVSTAAALSWFSSGGVNAYAAAKAAQCSMTNGIRLNSPTRHTQVTRAHLGLLTPTSWPATTGRRSTRHRTSAALDGVGSQPAGGPRRRLERHDQSHPRRGARRLLHPRSRHLTPRRAAEDPTNTGDRTGRGCARARSEVPARGHDLAGRASRSARNWCLLLTASRRLEVSGRCCQRCG